MHSYGDLLTSSLYAFPEFNKTFGSPVYKKGKISSYQLSAAWQSGLCKRFCHPTVKECPKC